MRVVNCARWVVGLSCLSFLVGCVGQDPSDSETSTQGEAITATSPPHGLLSNSNYIMADVAADGTCRDLKGIVVGVEVAKTLIADQGFTVQLNAYSPLVTGDATTQFVVQQYAFAVNSVLQFVINEWTTADLKSGQPLRPSATIPVTLPTTDQLPAGYGLTFALEEDKNNKVNVVKFEVSDGTNTTERELLTSPAIGATGSELAPIVAYTVDIVGPGSSMHAHFTQGSGTINYSSGSTAVSPLPALPSCVVSTKHTLETSNIHYSTLSAGASKMLSQTFVAN